MAVKLHPLFRIKILSRYGKIMDLADPCHGSNRQFTIKFVDGGDSLDL